MTPRPRVALAHDYLTQRGGAERVAEIMSRAFPDATLHTTLFEPDATFPEFVHHNVEVSPLNMSGTLRRHHRLALPVLAQAVSKMVIDADIVLASSSGWAHGMPSTGRKIVYCHAPARWLYQDERYLGSDRTMSPAQSVHRMASSVALRALSRRLREWDQQAAASAHRYLVNSRATQSAVHRDYGIDAEVLFPPPALGPVGDEVQVTGVEAPFLLCVARLLPYKNVDAVIEATLEHRHFDLVVVGEGPDRARLMKTARGSGRIHILGRVGDAQLRWLYRTATALVAASFEDFGLSPLEAASFGKPTLALRGGGYLDTVDDSVNGAFFDRPNPTDIVRCIQECEFRNWDQEAIKRHAQAFGEERFMQRLCEVVDEEVADL